MTREKLESNASILLSIDYELALGQISFKL